MAEPLVAHVAPVRSGGAVSRLVLLQVGLLAEPFAAHGTLEGALARVDLLVRGQVGLGGEVPPADGARVLALPRVHVLGVRLQAGEVAELLGADGAAEGLAGGVGAAVGGGGVHQHRLGGEGGGGFGRRRGIALQRYWERGKYLLHLSEMIEKSL